MVSASRVEQRVQDTLPTTTLITRAEIDASQAVDLPGLLRRAGAVELTQNGGAGTLASVFIRGAESRHTLVLIDGIAVNNLNFGTAALEHLALDSIERIEIVRGNVSSLYGSSALGGVIQIFTRRSSTGTQVSASVQAGSNGLGKFNAAVASSWESGTRLSANVETLKVTGFNAINQAERPGTNPDRDGYSRQSATFALVQSLGRLGAATQASSLGLRVRDARGQTQYDSEYGPPDQADKADFVERGTVLDGQFFVADGLRLSAAVSDNVDGLDAKVTAYPYFVKSSSRGAQLGLEWQLASGQRITSGVESTRQHLDSDTSYTRSQRQQDSVRVGYQAELEQHQLQLNLRQDKYSDFGSASTYYAGYAWRIRPEWRVNVSSSSGFNAPTFNDLYYPWGGNPALRPERVQSSELGLQYLKSGQELRVVWFANRFRDLIGNDANYTRVNVNSARNEGLELSYTAVLGATRVRASATQQDPVDLTTGKRLTLRAATLAHLGLGHSYAAASVDLDVRYSGTRPDGVRSLPAYAVADLSASYTLTPDLKASVRLDNLFNRQYETVYGYRQLGRALALGLTWTSKL